MAKMTQELIQALYEHGQAVYEGKESLPAATDVVIRAYSGLIANSSARFYIGLYEDLLSGKGSTWNQNSDLLVYYVEKIYADHGKAAAENALHGAMKFATMKSRQPLISALSNIAKQHNLEVKTSKDLPLDDTTNDELTDGRKGVFDSWEIIDVNTAIKTCDKSFFEHNGSGVPKDICWFFSANQLERGKTIRITLQYEGGEYAGRIANESSDRRRVRIFWSTDLGNQFSAIISQSPNNPAPRLVTSTPCTAIGTQSSTKAALLPMNGRCSVLTFCFRITTNRNTVRIGSLRVSEKLTSAACHSCLPHQNWSRRCWTSWFPIHRNPPSNAQLFRSVSRKNSRRWIGAGGTFWSER